MNVLIIEDEIKTAKELRRLIEGLDDTIRVLDIVSSVRSAVKWLNDHPSPDLIFSDIQLADGLSFDIYREVTVSAPVIFCTAFDEYAIQAFQANSIDYLLKPIDEDKLAQSLEKYKNLKKFFDPRMGNNSLSKLAGQLENNFKRSLLIYLREKIIPIKTGEIAYIHLANGLVTLVTRQEHKYVTQYNMEQLESMLDPQQFFRANRQFIINREIVQDVEQYFNRRLFLKLSFPTPEKIIISKVRSSEFLHWMEG
ncbi:MAG TPA: LytTR family DNA-binding domain-containing protein [Puia sp.]|jgi:DNA-binding LytR/AlgR family response regulator|nr:LytTR family DNA-binding domain-containing protein [Puia sp.]